MRPVNSILLHIDAPLQKEIIHGTLRLIAQPEYNPNEYATVTGRIAALPKYPRGEYSSIVKDLKVGDDVAFLYSVCSKIGFYNDSHAFHPATEGSDYLKEWYNGKGEKISVFAIKGVLTPRWLCTYMGIDGKLISGCDGKEHDMERWLSQFTFGSYSEMYFKNLIEIKGKAYWRADFREILAVKRGKDIIAAGDWICCNPIFIDQTTIFNLQNGTILQPKSIGYVYKDRAEVVSGMGFKKKEIVGAHEVFWNKYDLWGRKYYFIKNRRVYGTYHKSEQNPD